MAMSSPGIRVTYARDGSILFVDQLHQAGQTAAPTALSLPPGVTAQELQTMKGRVMLLGGLLAFALLGGPAALVGRFALGWAWTKSLLIGAGVGAAGFALWDWRVSVAAQQVALLNPPIPAPAATTTTTTTATTTPTTTVPGAASTASTASAVLSTPITATPPAGAAPQLGLQMNEGPVAPQPTTVIYNGVTIVLTPPPPPPLGAVAWATIALPVWTATFTLPGATAPQTANGTDPAKALSAAQAAIDTALATAVSVLHTTPGASMITPTTVVAASPPPGLKINLPHQAEAQLMSPITYRGVAVSFASSGGKVIATFTQPGRLVPQSAAPQPTYAAAVSAAQATIDEDLQAQGGP